MRHGYITLVPVLMYSIIGRERNRLKKIKADFIIRNMELGGTRFGFTYAGQRFTNYSSPELRENPLQPPAPELMTDIQYYFSDLKKMEHDVQKLKQALTVVLPRCKSPQDVRDVLPEVFTIDIPELAGLTRSRAEGFLLQEFPMLHGQYKIATEIAEYYTINKLIY